MHLLIVLPAKKHWPNPVDQSCWSTALSCCDLSLGLPWKLLPSPLDPPWGCWYHAFTKRHSDDCTPCFKNRTAATITTTTSSKCYFLTTEQNEDSYAWTCCHSLSLGKWSGSQVGMTEKVTRKLKERKGLVEVPSTLFLYNLISLVPVSGCTPQNSLVASVEHKLSWW